MLSVLYGSLLVTELRLPKRTVSREISSLEIAGRPAAFERNGRCISFLAPVTIACGNRLEILTPQKRLSGGNRPES